MHSYIIFYSKHTNREILCHSREPQNECDHFLFCDVLVSLTIFKYAYFCVYEMEMITDIRII